MSFRVYNIFVTFITNVAQQVHVLLFEGRPAVLVAGSSGNHNVSRGSRLIIIRVCENFSRNTHGFIMPSADNPPVTSLCPAHHRQVLHPERQRLVGVDPNAAPIRFGIDGTDYDPPRAIVLMIAQQTRDFHGIANGYGNAVHAVVVVDGYFAVRIGQSISIVRVHVRRHFRKGCHRGESLKVGVIIAASSSGDWICGVMLLSISRLSIRAHHCDLCLGGFIGAREAARQHISKYLST